MLKNALLLLKKNRKNRRALGPLPPDHKRRHGEGGGGFLHNVILATFPNRPDPLSFLRWEGV